MDKKTKQQKKKRTFTNSFFYVHFRTFTKSSTIIFKIISITIVLLLYYLIIATKLYHLIEFVVHILKMRTHVINGVCFQGSCKISSLFLNFSNIVTRIRNLKMKLSCIYGKIFSHTTELEIQLPR